MASNQSSTFSRKLSGRKSRNSLRDPKMALLSKLQVETDTCGEDLEYKFENPEVRENWDDGNSSDEKCSDDEDSDGRDLEVNFERNERFRLINIAQGKAQEAEHRENLRQTLGHASVQNKVRSEIREMGEDEEDMDLDCGAF